MNLMINNVPIDRNKLSPMMRHYADIKNLYPDCFVFYRLGDFYEMFFDDAVKASSILDLTLTGRDCGLSERAPMCGIPFHAADLYISKLVSTGNKVAICEQLSEPNGKNLVDRSVIKIVTAGTVTSNDLIDEKKNNFIGCVYIKDGQASFSWADITTGEFFVESFTKNTKDYLSSLSDLIVKISPVEIISNDIAADIFNNSPLCIHNVIPKFTETLDSDYNLINAQETIKKQFNVSNLSIYGIEDDKTSICSAGALISYLKQTQMHALLNINSIKKESDDNHLIIDQNALKNLELVKTLRDGKKHGSLLWVLDKTKTSMGARKIYNWILSPLNSIEKINNRLDAVECLYNNSLIRNQLSELLSLISDIGRLTGRISNNNLNPRDCISLKESLKIIPNIQLALSGINCNYINDISNNFGYYFDLVELLEKSIDINAPVSIKEGGFIKRGYNKELDELNDISSYSQKYICDIETRERKNTGIKTLKIAYNRVFGYYIEVTNSYKDLVPYNYERKQTISNAERYVTQELKDLEVKILSSKEQAIILEQKFQSFFAIMLQILMVLDFNYTTETRFYFVLLF